MPDDNNKSQNIMDDPTLGGGESTVNQQAEPSAPNEPASVEENEVQALLAEMEKAGVTNAQDFNNVRTAAAESGRMANLLGEVREQNNALKQELAEMRGALKSTSRQPGNDQGGFDDLFGNFQNQPNPYQGQNVDIKGAINEVLNEREQKTREQTQRAQQAILQAWNTITNDEDYGLVKDVWEEKLKDPNFVFQINSGQVNPIGEYQRMLRNYYKNMVKGSANLIKKLTGERKLGPQHLEQGGNTPANLVQGNQRQNPRVARVNELKQKAAKGLLNEEEEMELATMVFT